MADRIFCSGVKRPILKQNVRWGEALCSVHAAKLWTRELKKTSNWDKIDVCEHPVEVEGGRREGQP